MNILRICSKVVDRFTAELLRDNEVVASHDGYVPDFMPGNHYGDYIELDIDIKTGQILNWDKVSPAIVKKQFNNEL